MMFKVACKSQKTLGGYIMYSIQVNLRLKSDLQRKGFLQYFANEYRIYRYLYYNYLSTYETTTTDIL